MVSASWKRERTKRAMNAKCKMLFTIKWLLTFNAAGSALEKR